MFMVIAGGADRDGRRQYAVGDLKAAQSQFIICSDAKFDSAQLSCKLHSFVVTA